MHIRPQTEYLILNKSYNYNTDKHFSLFEAEIVLDHIFLAKTKHATKWTDENLIMWICA